MLYAQLRHEQVRLQRLRWKLRQLRIRDDLQLWAMRQRLWQRQLRQRRELWELPGGLRLRQRKDLLPKQLLHSKLREQAVRVRWLRRKLWKLRLRTNLQLIWRMPVDQPVRQRHLQRGREL